MKLTEKQENELIQYVEERSTEALKYTVLAKDTANDITDATYAFLGEHRPKQVIIAQSPLEAWKTINKLCDDENEFWWPYISGRYSEYYFAWVDFYLDNGAELDEEYLSKYKLLKEANKEGLVFPLDEACIVCPMAEEIHIKDNQLHNEKGPSILYPDGFSIYALNGISVSKEVVELDPKEMNKTWLTENFIKERNVEVRREIIRKMGADMLCSRIGYTVTDTMGSYKLIHLNIKEEEPRPYLLMKNPSIDAIHIEGVPANITDVAGALRFRNGLTKNDIDDVNGKDWYQQGDVCLFPKAESGEKVKYKSKPIQLT